MTPLRDSKEVYYPVKIVIYDGEQKARNLLFFVLYVKQTFLICLC